MSVQYSFQNNSYDLEKELKLGNKIFSNRILEEFPDDGLEQISDQHFRYNGTDFAFDIDREEVQVAVYGEKETTDEILETLEGQIDDINEESLTSHTLDY